LGTKLVLAIVSESMSRIFFPYLFNGVFEAIYCFVSKFAN